MGFEVGGSGPRSWRPGIRNSGTFGSGIAGFEPLLVEGAIGGCRTSKNQELPRTRGGSNPGCTGSYPLEAALVAVAAPKVGTQ